MREIISCLISANYLPIKFMGWCNTQSSDGYTLAAEGDYSVFIYLYFVKSERRTALANQICPIFYVDLKE
jgi:hypothetical protein